MMDIGSTVRDCCSLICEGMSQVVPFPCAILTGQRSTKPGNFEMMVTASVGSCYLDSICAIRAAIPVLVAKLGLLLRRSLT